MPDTTPVGRALVTGATGAVGPALVRRLVGLGVTVRAVARHDPPPGLIGAGVEFVRADLGDAPDIRRLVDGVDAVFHLAARLHVVDPDSSMRSRYVRDNVDATRRLVDACDGQARFIFFSTIDVYSPTRDGEVVDERTQPQPRSLYGETKLQAEQVALAYPSSTVLRMAAVYGGRVKGNYARLVRAIAGGRFVMVGPGLNRRTLVYDEDVASAAWLAAIGDRARGETYNVTDGELHTVREIVAAIVEAAAPRFGPWAVPERPVRFGVAALERGLGLVSLRSPVTRSMLDKLLEDFAVSGRRLQDELGFRPALRLREGWRAALRQIEQHRGVA